MPAIVEPIRRSDSLSAARLKPQQLYRPCDAATLGFQTTGDLPECAITLGQDRAIVAIQFGIGIRAAGDNLFALGSANAEQPLSLTASIVFEQSYGGVEGDSASSAELYALLSALAEAPLKQSIAVTGSVNQRGEVQAVGGINEKIEGFFDVCNARGLTGREGVLIPAANTRHLMLRRDVIDAVAEGRFHVYAIDTVDQGVEILTGTPAGTRDASGTFAEASINGKVERRLIALASQAHAFKIAGESLEAQRSRTGSTPI